MLLHRLTTFHQEKWEGKKQNKTKYQNHQYNQTTKQNENQTKQQQQNTETVNIMWCCNTMIVLNHRFETRPGWNSFLTPLTIWKDDHLTLIFCGQSEKPLLEILLRKGKDKDCVGKCILFPLYSSRKSIKMLLTSAKQEVHTFTACAFNLVPWNCLQYSFLFCMKKLNSGT